MHDIFSSIQSLVKLESVCIDNNVFRVHYKVTVVLLIVCSVLINARQYFGDPINCTFEPTSEHIIDDFCWINSYVTIPKDHALYHDIEYYTNSGIIKSSKDNTYDVRQMHYQWIGVIIFFQAILFFIPRFIWKYNLEDGKIKSLAKDITTLFPDPDKQLMKINLVINFLKGNLGQNQVYFFQFFSCEMLNLLNVFVQLLLMDRFLGYEFSTYGFGVFGLTNQVPTQRQDPMNHIFPKVVKCDFNKAGHTGDDQPFRALCVLPANVFNEKIFIFLWFWFVLVAIISVLGLIYRILTIFVPKVRAYILHRKFAFVNEEAFEVSMHPGKSSDISEEEAIDIITDRFKVGDWFILYQVGKNMDGLVFGNLVKDFVQRLKNENYLLNKKRNAQNPRLVHKDSLKCVDVSKPFL